MRTSFCLLGACVPIAACSTDLVTAPTPVAPTGVTVSIRGASPERGTSSVLGSSPVIIVDGVVVRIVNGVAVGLNDINADDIESIEVIKGASATAIYGTEVRCPAIVITTRRTPGASPPQPGIR